MRVSDVLSAIRNALAHGNLYTKPTIRGEIKQIVFVTGLQKRKTGEIINPFRFVQVEPDDFKLFLNKWFAFLSSLELPKELLAELLPAA